MSVEGKKNWQPNPDITPEELAEMRVEVLDRIIIARVGLLLPTNGFLLPQLMADIYTLTHNSLMHLQIKKLNLLLHMKFYIVCLITLLVEKIDFLHYTISPQTIL